MRKNSSLIIIITGFLFTLFLFNFVGAKHTEAHFTGSPTIKRSSINLEPTPSAVYSPQTSPIATDAPLPADSPSLQLLIITAMLSVFIIVLGIWINRR